MTKNLLGRPILGCTVSYTYLLTFTFSASDVTTGEFDRDVTSPLEHEQHLKV